MQLLCGEHRVKLGARLGRGGEGEVLEIVGQPTLAAKLYHQPDRTHEAKIAALISANLSQRCRAVTFPLEIIRFGDGRFAGFVMPKIAGRQPIHELLGIASMKRYFPRANWSFLVRVALNLSRTIASVHAAGVVIGDINSAGILVGQDATVTLIDADSVQFGQFGCRVGMAEYTPPELQGVTLSSVARTINHDAFGLAILIFQILALGRHPFSGVRRNGALLPAEAIAQNRFAYSLLRETGLKPPPAALQLSELPLGIRVLFERAFAPTAGSRPTASDWVNELRVMEQGLARCAVRPDHVIPSPALPCPWCRLERVRTTQLFPAPKLRATTSERPWTPLLAKVSTSIKVAKNLAGETVRPHVARTLPTPSAVARMARKVEGQIRQQGYSIKQLANFGSGPRREIAANFIQADADVSRAIQDWRTRIGVWETHKLCSEIETLVRKFEVVLTRRSHIEANEFEQDLRRRATGLIAGKSLANAMIPGIRQGVIATLAKAGVRNAADLLRVGQTKLQGIGAARTFSLLLWRDQVLAQAESSLRADPVSVAAATAEAKRRYRNRVNAFESAIDAALGKLNEHVLATRAAINRSDPAVARACYALDQAISDLRHLGYDPVGNNGG